MGFEEIFICRDVSQPALSLLHRNGFGGARGGTAGRAALPDGLPLHAQLRAADVLADLGRNPLSFFFFRAKRKRIRVPMTHSQKRRGQNTTPANRQKTRDPTPTPTEKEGVPNHKEPHRAEEIATTAEPTHEPARSRTTAAGKAHRKWAKRHALYT